MDIEGKIAIVSGGASGLGAATAQALAAKGAKVAILDFNIDGANTVAAAIGGIAIQCNVSDAASAEAAFKAIGEKLGSPHILVNCAGVAPAKKMLARDGSVMPLDDFRRAVEINLIGSFNLLRLLPISHPKAKPCQRASAALSSIRHRLQPLTDRSARRPMQRLKAVSLA